MAGSHVVRPRAGRFAVALAASLFSFAGGARAQDRPPLPLAAAPARSFADVVESDDPAVTPVSATFSGPSYYPGAAAVSPRIVTNPFETVAESLCAKPDPDTWHPLLLSSLFTEGWDEAWVPSPNGSGGAPRQGWINAADGNLYRLWFFTFAQAFNSGRKGDAYLGSFTIFLPLSRRLDLIVNTPFVVRNNSISGQPIIDPNNPQTPTFRSRSGFGDMSFTPRVLLHETKDFSLTSELAVIVPTGQQPLAGKTQLVPNVSFWYNPAGRWVIRGGVGDLIPLRGSGANTLISQLALGYTFTDHDVPLFGDFTFYVSAVADTPLDQGKHTSVTLTPGIRTHVGRDWYFLAGLPTPVTNARVGDLGMIFWFMKAW